MFRIVLFLAALAAFVAGFAVTTAYASESGDPARLLAQSCVGESGWDAGVRGECAAQWWVYRNRIKGRSGWTIERMVRKYSAAVKHPKRRWVVELNRAGTRPKSWPRNLNWPKHRVYWRSILLLADNFMAGHVPNPSPGALHYGGRMDRHRLSPDVWVRMDTPWAVNLFYRQRKSGRKEPSQRPSLSTRRKLRPRAQSVKRRILASAP